MMVARRASAPWLLQPLHPAKRGVLVGVGFIEGIRDVECCPVVCWADLEVNK